jgi:hypothetical protein
MNRLHLNIWIFLSFFALSINLAVAQEITVRASANSCGIGDVVQVTYEITGGGQISLPATPGFQSVGTQQYQRNVNGKYSTSITLNLRAIQEGSHTIGPLIVQSSAGTFRSQNVLIKVGPSSQGTTSSSEPKRSATSSERSGDLILVVEPSRKRVYVGEPFSISATLYSQSQYVQFEDIVFPEIRGGLSRDVPEAADNSFRRGTYNGQTYLTATLKKWILVPQREGTLEIDPITARLLFQKITPSQDPWENFFRGGKVQEQRMNVSSTATKVEVKPLPESGRPSGFQNAVGQFSLEVLLDKTSGEVNDAFTFSVRVKGNGNLSILRFPEYRFPDAFEVSEPVVKENTSVSGDGISGSVRKDFLLIARRPGKFVLPPVNFSYFDPKTGTYQTLYSDSLQVKVWGDASSFAGDGSAAAPVDFQELGTDIRFIKEDNQVLFKTPDHRFFGTLLYWLLFGFAALLPVVLIRFRALIIPRRRSDSDQRHQKAVSMAKKRLTNARKLLDKELHEEAGKEIWAALQTYLSDRLTIPLQQQDDRQLVKLLEQKGLESQWVSLSSIKKNCEQVLYSPQPKALSAMVYEQALEWIVTTEKLRK